MAAKAPRSYRYTDILALYEERERNALLPDRDERCLQSSSTDSRSVYDEATDTYLYWDANSGDGYCYHGAFTDENGVNYIALDVKGAGFLSGLWFGTLNEGEADLIIDGVRFDNGGRRAKDLFEARGKFEGLDGLIYNTPGPAWIFDLPISFSKSCRIVLREGWGLYYHIDYVLFPEGTQVEPFPSEFSPEQRKAVETLNAHFLNQDNYVLPMPASEPERLRAGEIRTVFETSGSGALSSVHLLIPGFSDMTPYERERLSLGLTISMYWDGSDQPAVWAPVGGFFGSPLGDPLDSFALTLTEDGHFLSRFLMPYADGARIELHNETEADIDFRFAVETASLSRP
ncbi:MAG: DUF2961 domain-containing protein, partial [Clostridia bacterium]|nr:DUF2961 domain-containing protein [Clostridia bacterium]